MLTDLLTHISVDLFESFMHTAFYVYRLLTSFPILTLVCGNDNKNVFYSIIETFALSAGFGSWPLER